MSLVLFSTTPGQGHVQPMLPLARALRAAGHDVRWAVAASALETVTREGFAAREAGLPERERYEEFTGRFAEWESLPGPQRRAFGFSRMFGAVAAPVMARTVVPLVEEWRPDVVVRDACEFAGAIAAAAIGVPSVTHAFGLPVPRSAVAAADEVLAELWRACDLEPRPLADADAMYVDICPSSLHNGDEAPVRRRQRLRPADGSRGERPARPLVYVTFGTAFNKDAALLRETVAGVAAADVDVLVTVGNDGDVGAVAGAGPHVTVERYVPQASVLPRAAAVVSHGGAGTLLGALAHGLPNVLLPQGADHFDNVAQAVAAGAAVAIGTGGAPRRDDVTAAVRRVLGEPSFAEAAARVAAEIAAMPAPSDAAAAVASLAG